MLELRKSKRALERENDAMAKAVAKEKADAKAEATRAKAEAEAKAASKKPELKYLCNLPRCHFKSPHKKCVTDHWDLDRAHGKKGKNGPYCKECGNYLGNSFTCRTFDDKCPRINHITGYKKLQHAREEAAKAQADEAAKDQASDRKWK